MIPTRSVATVRSGKFIAELINLGNAIIYTMLNCQERMYIYFYMYGHSKILLRKLLLWFLYVDMLMMRTEFMDSNVIS